LKLKTLFSPEKIGNIQIKNRIVRSATYVRRAEKYGMVGDQLIHFYRELAQGGTGLIISGFTAVDPSGTASVYQVRLDEDSFISGHQKLVSAIHDYPYTKIAAQIAHTGRQGVHPKYPPVAPSAVPDKTTGLTPRELKIEEIRELISKFVNTGYRAYIAGYDMVQLHAAHGYLLSNFISPYTNRRVDEFGGNSENMARILIEIYNGLRDKIGNSFPIIIKLQTKDFVPGGLILDDATKITKILVDHGFDAIEPSGGIAETQVGVKEAYPSKAIKTPEEENYFLPICEKLKPIMKGCKLILMGGIKNPISAEKFLQEGIADFISMSRPLIYEPDLPNRWESGDLNPAKCISCNSCYMTMLTGPVHCVVRKRKERKEKKKEKEV